MTYTISYEDISFVFRQSYSSLVNIRIIIVRLPLYITRKKRLSASPHSVCHDHNK